MGSFPLRAGGLAAVACALALTLPAAVLAASPPISVLKSGYGNAVGLSPSGTWVADTATGISGSGAPGFFAVQGAVGTSDMGGLGSAMMVYNNGLGKGVLRVDNTVDDITNEYASSVQGVTSASFDSMNLVGYVGASSSAGVYLTNYGGIGALIAGNGSDEPTPFIPTSGSSPTSGWVGDVHGVAIDPSSDANLIFTSNTHGLDGKSPGKLWLIKDVPNALPVSDGNPPVITLLAGDGNGPDGGTAASATLGSPSGAAYLKDGGYLVLDSGRIRRISSGGPAAATISTIAGGGSVSPPADGTPADQAGFVPGQMVVTDDGIVLAQGTEVVRVPAAAITGGPDAITSAHSAAFTLASWDSAATFECALDSQTLSPCDPAQSFSDLADGLHTLTVTAATDDLGRTSNPVTRTWLVDSTPPAAFEATGPADGATTGANVDFTWPQTSDAGSGIDHYELWLDGAKVADGCCETKLLLPDGLHTWEVRAVDKAGNTRATSTRTVTVSSPPTATLTVAPERTLVNRTVTFDASGSSDLNGRVVDYRWDLDGDGTYETDTGSTPTATRSYGRPQSLTVAVQVRDDGGLTSVATAPLLVSSLPPAGRQLGVSINDGAQFTNDPHVTIYAVWPTFASDALISNDGGFGHALDFPVAAQIPWTLDSSGPERLPKTIYVRFLGGPQTSETYQDDIILDQTPPKVLSASLTPQAGAARAARAARVTLHLKATDNVSGVAKVQVTANKRKPGRLVAYRKSLKVLPARRLFVRVRDRAGNLSAWRTATRR